MTSIINTNGNHPPLDNVHIGDFAKIIGFIADDNGIEDGGDRADEVESSHSVDEPPHVEATVSHDRQSIPTNESSIEEDGENTGTVNLSSHYQNDDEVDDEEVLNTDPHSNRTKVTLINSPFSQMALVAGGVLVVILAIGGTLTMLTADRTATPAIAPSPSAETETDPKNPTADTPDETSKYKTEAAMGHQKELLKGTRGQPQPQVTPAPANKRLTPAAIVAPAPPTVPMPVMAPVLPATPPEKPNLEDSVRTWQLLSSVGSYGRVPTSGSNNNTPRTTPTPSTTLFSPSPASSNAVMPTVAASSSSGMGIQQLRASSAVPGMRDRPLVPVLVGTHTKGQLRTAMVLSGDNSSPIDPTNPRSTKYLVQLSDALKDGDGAIAIPAGALIVTTIRTFSPTTGKAELQAVAVITHNREYKLPDSAIIIRAADGGTLALKQQSSGGAKFFQAVLPALMSGLSQAGQAINQPTSSATISSGNVTTSSTTNKDPNIAAAFTSGAANTLSQQLTQQVQAANQAASQQQKAWAIGAGTPVQVFVNSTFEM